MPEQPVGKSFTAGNPAENYERYFVPAIGGPLAADLIRLAKLRPGEGVLDVACGTGVVARLALEEVGVDGRVAGLDVNPAMLAVARSRLAFQAEQHSATPVAWHEASAGAMPLPDASFDVVLCQMGLQFMEDKQASLREMRRVLADGGRVMVSVPGPTPRPLTMMAEELQRHIGPEAAGFVHRVFSLYDTEEIQNLFSGAGFRDFSVHSYNRTLHLPPPEEFLWQYVYSTPLAGLVAQADARQRESLERDLVAKWQEFVQEGALVLPVRMTVATARK